VLVSVPTDWQGHEVEVRWQREVEVEEPVASAAMVERAADLVMNSRRPVILAGRGLHDPARRPAVVALADRIGAALTTSLVVKGAFTGHPYDLGVCGGMASQAALEVMGQADLAIVLGCSLTHWTTRGGALFQRGLEIIHCDLDASAIVDAGVATLAVVGDAGDFAERLDCRLRDDGFQNAGFRSEDLRRRLREPDGSPVAGGAELDPRSLTLALEALIPRERTIVQDGGHFSGWGPTLMSAPDQRGFDWGQSFMSVGLGVGAAIGAAVGRPDRRTVLIAGDGGLMMSLGDLESVSRLDVSMLVIVFNDRAYGAEIGILEALGLPTALACHPDVDLAAVARALGFAGVTVRRLEDLDAVAGAIADPTTRLLLDCKVDPTVRGKWFVEAFGKDSWLQRMSASPR
jgi:thiamine pyrophosphate-dependent acetolactate synthase large subunit-like protein